MLGFGVAVAGLGYAAKLLLLGVSVGGWGCCCFLTVGAAVGVSVGSGVKLGSVSAP